MNYGWKFSPLAQILLPADLKNRISSRQGAKRRAKPVIPSESEGSKKTSPFGRNDNWFFLRVSAFLRLSSGHALREIIRLSVAALPREPLRGEEGQPTYSCTPKGIKKTLRREAVA
jgi:hypothetical protein